MRDNQPQHNPFDEIGLNLDHEEIKKQQEELKAKHEHLDYLIHRTFAQTESGTELLKMWSEALQMTPDAKPGMDQIEIGIIAGKKEFIRNIILTINRVERNE